MNRAIPFVLSVTSVAVAFACGSTGSGQTNSVPPAASATTFQSPFFSDLQAGGNQQAPAPSPYQPATNTNAPASNPDQAPSTGPTPGASEVCSMYCGLFTSCGSFDTCMATCNQYSALITPCAAEASAVVTCIQQVGFTCRDNGGLRPSTDACDPILSAFISCILPDGGEIIVTTQGSGGSPAGLQ